MTIEETQELADAYGDAWNRHDIAALLDMQTDDMTFHLHVEGSEPVSGRESLEGLFGFFFATMPDYHADVARATVCEDLIVLEYTISATLAQPFPLGAVTGVPTGEQMRVEAVDVLPCSGGKVARKDTYVDGFALRRGFGL